MASPQTENGFTRISNEIMDALSGIRISGEEMQVLWVILRKTYGWQKKADAISLSQFSLATKLRKPDIIRAITRLISKNLISKKANAVANIFSFNKDFNTWKPLAKKQTFAILQTSVSKKANAPLAILQTSVSNIANAPLAILLPTKERIKEIKEKDICAPEKILNPQDQSPVQAMEASFKSFWDEYPFHNGKKPEEKETFRRFCILPSGQWPELILAAKNYAVSQRVKEGIGIKDPKNFIGTDHNPGIWRDWIEAEIPKTGGDDDDRFESF